LFRSAKLKLVAFLGSRRPDLGSARAGIALFLITALFALSLHGALLLNMKTEGVAAD
jgi:hypothetical protein